MEAEQALKIFLDSALSSKKERYVGFVSKKKTRSKFLSAIYHELEGNLDASKKVTALPEHALAMPGYKFEPPNSFGEPITTLDAICNTSDESFLVVSVDGKYGVHGPETFIDSRAFYAI